MWLCVLLGSLMLSSHIERFIGLPYDLNVLLVDLLYIESGGSGKQRSSLFFSVFFNLGLIKPGHTNIIRDCSGFSQIQ